MLTYLRYALATICLALSVACLGLWGWSLSGQDVYVFHLAPNSRLAFESCAGSLDVTRITARGFLAGSDNWVVKSSPILPERSRTHAADVDAEGRFAFGEGHTRFPLWYAALVFALASIGALRLGRRFMLRSAIIATTVVAGLLGMVVAR
ncbi:hypothetical protein [Lacipirellula sp.]|uniref:hypothetical protein n=1 Tax=Lacipirellula sp. TaxID=2691419 RepID=UPI003D0EAF64